MTIVAIAFPVGDWQFWAVTACALAAAAYLLRGALPARLRPRTRRGQKTPLTIGGKTPERSHSRNSGS